MNLMPPGTLPERSRTLLNSLLQGSFLVQFATRSDLAAANMPAAISFVYVAGYAEAGDGGGSYYVWRAAAPTHPGKVQSADGGWWEILAPVLTPKHFGYPMDGTGDGAAALTNTFAAAIATGAYASVGVESDITRIKSSVTLPSKLKLLSQGGMILADRVAAVTHAVQTDVGSTGIVIEGTHIRNNAVTGAGRSCLNFGQNTTDLLIKSGCVFDQDPADGNTIPGDYEGTGIRIQAPGCKNITIEAGIRYRWLKYGVLVSNILGGHSAAYDASKISILGGDFDYIAAEGIAINSPNDVYDAQMLITIGPCVINVPRGVTNIASTRDNDGLGISVAGSTRVSVSGAVIRTRRQGYHVEDEAREVSITGGSVSGMGYYPSVTTIAFVAGSPASITDSALNFWEKGFRAGDEFAITGSASNNVTRHIASISANGGTLTLRAGETLVNEAAGASVTLDGHEGVGSSNLIHVVPASISTVTTPLVKNLSIVGVSVSQSKGRGINIDYGVSYRATHLTVTGNPVEKCADSGIYYGGNVETFGAITGNPISDCGTAITLAGSGEGVVVDNNPIQNCTNGIAFADNKWGAVLGKNPMQGVTNKYAFSSINAPLTIGFDWASYEATQPAGTGLYTAWTDSIYLGDSAVGTLTMVSRDPASPASFNSQVFSASWNGTTLTCTPIGGTSGGSMAAYTSNLLPQMNGKWLQTRTRKVTTSAVNLAVTAEFRGQILAGS